MAASARLKPDPSKVVDVQAVTHLFALASDPTRLAVLGILARGEQNVGDLCTLLQQSQPSVSHHLALLRVAGIIAPRRQGKHNFYSLEPRGELIVSAALALS